MEYEGGDISYHDWEVDSAAWFPIEEALKKANYRGEKEIIEKARKKTNKNSKHPSINNQIISSFQYPSLMIESFLLFGYCNLIVGDYL